MLLSRYTYLFRLSVWLIFIVVFVFVNISQYMYSPILVTQLFCHSSSPENGILIYFQLILPRNVKINIFVFVKKCQHICVCIWAQNLIYNKLTLPFFHCAFCTLCPLPLVHGAHCPLCSLSTLLVVHCCLFPLCLMYSVSFFR